jgi:hypothetical protein
MNLVERKRAHFAFDFDQWFALLRQADVTFDAVILPLAPAHVNAMLNFYGVRFLNRSPQTLTQLDERRLLEITAALKPHFAASGAGAWFVRMSNRSPKDGVRSSENVFDEWRRIRARTANANDCVVEMLSAQLQSLMCRSIDDVMSLLLTSERVFRDNREAIECNKQDGADIWRTSIILRPWLPRLREWNEWRVFVHQRHAVAISQYCHLACFKQLIAADIAALARHITAFVEQRVMPALSDSVYNSAVVDVVVFDDTDALETAVIEINPFDRATGAALFDWNDILMPSSPPSDVPIRIVNKEDLTASEALIESMFADEEVMSKELRAPWQQFLKRKT